MRSVVELLRKWNRARLERRQALKASGEAPRGALPRLVHRLKAKNRSRLARRRARAQLLASLAANDTAVLEALVFLLRAARDDQRARAEADEALARRLAALDARVDEGVALLGARLQSLEVRLAGPAGGGNHAVEPGPAAGVDGEERSTRA